MKQNKLLSFVIYFFIVPLSYVASAFLLLFVLPWLYVKTPSLFALSPQDPRSSKMEVRDRNQDSEIENDVTLLENRTQTEVKQAEVESDQNIKEVSFTKNPPEEFPLTIVEDQKNKMPVIMESCGQSWQTPLVEIKGVIKKVEYRTQPQIGQRGLHLDVKPTAQQDIVVVHVFPEIKTKECPDLFRFQEGETVTVVGSRFSTPRHRENICAAKIIRQDSKPLKPDNQNSEVLSLRDSETGNHISSVFHQCVDENELQGSCLVNWLTQYTSAVCEECKDEIVAWDSSAGLLKECQKCADKMERIPSAYTKDCSICQEVACSRCPDSDLPPRCWKNCMKNCGKNTGRVIGNVVKKFGEKSTQDEAIAIFKASKFHSSNSHLAKESFSGEINTDEEMR